MKVPDITATRRWSMYRMRRMCMDNDLYTSGGVSEYNNMLGFVDTTKPTYENIYLVAADINAHSENQTVENIMYLIERHVVVTMFGVDYVDKISSERSETE